MARQPTSFRMPDPEEIFQPVSVDSRDLYQFRRNRVTKELLRRIQGEIFNLSSRAFSDDEETYETRKGKAKGLKWVLEQMEDIATGTDDVRQPDEDEESEIV